MNLFQLPPQALVTKMVPILCRVVGVVFILGGILELVLVPVILFMGKENTVLFSLVFLVGAIVSVGVGSVILKLMPDFMLTSVQKLRQNSPFDLN